MQLRNGNYQSQNIYTLTIAGLLATVLFVSTMRHPTPTQAQNGSSLRFYGSGAIDHDRVKIPLGPLNASGHITASYPVNIDSAFTIEF